MTRFRQEPNTVSRRELWCSLLLMLVVSVFLSWILIKYYTPDQVQMCVVRYTNPVAMAFMTAPT